MRRYEELWTPIDLSGDFTFEEDFPQIERIAEALGCKVDEIESTSTEELSEAEEIAFDCEVIGLDAGTGEFIVDPFYLDDNTGAENFYSRYRIALRKLRVRGGGFIVAETVSDTGGTITNFYRKRT